jgi:CBS domain containing-hemolysin-like protein
MTETAIIAIAIGLAVFLVAYFSGIEVAFNSANRLNIELKKKQGRSSGIFLSYLFDNPSRFIGVTTVGLTFFLVIAILLGTAFWNMLIDWSKFKGYKDLAMALRLVAEIFIYWFIIMIVAQFIPRAIFKAKSDSLLSFSARSGILGFFDRGFFWVANSFIKLAVFILNIIFDMRFDRRKELLSRADPDLYYQQSNESHNDNPDLNTELFENALSLAKVRVRECLVPRKEIEAVDINISVEELRKKLVETRLTKLVVYNGNIDNIEGYIHQLDLFKHPQTLRDILLPIPAVPESMSATDLISKFSKERKSIAWVVDEFGGTAGIVTMEDLLEEIFGEIKDEYDVEEFEEKQVSEEEYIFSGRLELDYLNEKYGLEFPENDSETLSGFIIHQHETIPRPKERIIIGDYEFEVINVSDTRIEMVRMKILK